MPTTHTNGHSAEATPPVEREYLTTIKALVEGFPVEIVVDASPRALPKIVRRLAELGYEPQPSGTSARPTSSKPAELRQRPTFDGDGDPCCPIHDKKLKEGRYGLYCASKAEGELANDKGYCRYSWRSE